MNIDFNTINNHLDINDSEKFLVLNKTTKSYRVYRLVHNFAEQKLGRMMDALKGCSTREELNEKGKLFFEKIKSEKSLINWTIVTGIIIGDSEECVLSAFKRIRPSRFDMVEVDQCTDESGKLVYILFD